MSRIAAHRVAWGLFAAGLLLGGTTVLGKAVVWSRAFPAGIAPGFTVPLLLFVLSLFSNVVFLVSPGMVGEPASRAWIALLVAFTAVNASLAFFFTVFVQSVGYWLWLAAFAAMTWAFAGFPPDRPSKLPKGSLSAGVPDLLWAWLGCTLFWIAVTAVNYRDFKRGHPSGASGPPASIADYVQDDSRILPFPEAQSLRSALAAFETETSSQLAVALYPKIPSGALEEFTLKTAERSRLGRKGLDNGAILFVFPADRAARLEVGYGLEGALPDALVHRILEEKLTPALAHGDVARGVEDAVAAILEAARAEYHAGKRKGPVVRAWEQAKVLVPRVLSQLWPFLRDLPLGGRVGLSFFGTLIGFGVASGVANGFRMGRNGVQAVVNVARRRPVGQGLAAVEFESVWDTLKLAAVLVLVVAAGLYIVAGGGAYGGAGAAARW